jgi:hypothetical protein
MAAQAMYVATFILFLIPWSIICVAWKGSLKSAKEPNHLDWRAYMFEGGADDGDLSSLYGNGLLSVMDSRGRKSAWGNAQTRTVAGTPTYRGVVSRCNFGYGAFAKGKGRLLVVTSAISIFFVIYLLAALEMD